MLFKQRIKLAEEGGPVVNVPLCSDLSGQRGQLYKAADCCSCSRREPYLLICPSEAVENPRQLKKGCSNHTFYERFDRGRLRNAGLVSASTVPTADKKVSIEAGRTTSTVFLSLPLMAVFN